MAERGRGKDFREAADQFMRRYDKGGKRALARAVALWEETVGPQVAAHTKAVAAREGELQVHVDSNAWATELSLMAPAFVEAINRSAGKTLVRSIRFTVTKGVDLERRRDRAESEHDAWPDRDKVVPESLDSDQAEQVERSVASIEDEALRAAARRAMTADLEWKKAARRSGSDAPDPPKKGPR